MNSIEVNYMKFIKRVLFGLVHSWIYFLMIISTILYLKFGLIPVIIYGGVLFVLLLVKVVFDSIYFVKRIDFSDKICIIYYKYDKIQDVILLDGNVYFEFVRGGLFAFSSDYLLVSNNGNKILKIRRIGEWWNKETIELTIEDFIIWESKKSKISS